MVHRRVAPRREREAPLSGTRAPASHVLTVVWFGLDLRLADNPALTAAVARGDEILPVFILDDEDSGEWRPGAASRWWLHESLQRLSDAIAARGANLVLRRGRAEEMLDALIRESGADAVYWNRRYEPWAVSRNARIKQALVSRGIAARSFNASLLSEPGKLLTQSGEAYRVFTPFWNALRTRYRPEEPLAAPERMRPAVTNVSSDDIASWSLHPARPDWSGGLSTSWEPGEQGATNRLTEFVAQDVFEYRERRNDPGTDGTSRLSPHLHFGEIGPRQVWWAVTERAMRQHGIPMPAGVETFLSEIAWREFSYHLLFNFPELPDAPWRAEFARIKWSRSTNALSAWQQGMTGYPIVDAGMRQLWFSGWMHNRVRMITASFLIKDLLIDWRQGERWFWDTLVDADLASNAAGWQWVAGSGADAAPYFRVFNPVLQSRKFDPEGRYIRAWLPELAGLSDKLIHAPWEATSTELHAAGLELGRNYPLPIIDHATARERALAAFERMKAMRSPG